MSVETIAIGSDVLVEWLEPEDEADNTFLGIDATGTVTLKDAAGSGGTPISGADGLSMTYTAGPPRRYQATIPDTSTATLTAATVYYITVTLTDSSGTPKAVREWPVTAAYER